jgi:hypothetical protein
MAAVRSSVALFPILRPISRADIPALVRRAVLVLLATGATRLVCDARDAHADATTIDALARIALVARRLGAVLELCGTDELLALLELCALREIL